MRYTVVVIYPKNPLDKYLDFHGFFKMEIKVFAVDVTKNSHKSIFPPLQFLGCIQIPFLGCNKILFIVSIQIHFIPPNTFISKSK